jgi:uncharacterized protein
MRWARATRQGRTCHPFVAAPQFRNGADMGYDAGSNLGAIMRHAIIAVLAAAVLFVVSPLRAQTPPTTPLPAENLAAARELIGVMKATDQFKLLLPGIFEALKPAIVQDRPDVAKDYDTIVPIVTAAAVKRLDQFADMMAGIYARNFSVDDIRDLIAFYRSPTGQRLIAQQPVIAQQSLAAGQQFGQELVEDIKEQITEELKKRGDAK